MNSTQNIEESKRSSVVISIGNLPILINSLDPEPLESISKNYNIYLSDAEPIFSLNVVADPSVKGAPIGADQIWPMHTRYDNQSIEYKSRESEGHIDFVSKIALLRFKPEGEVDFIVSFQNFLRVLYSNLLLENEGALIHSANLIRNNKGYLFFGKSGSGKTTVSESIMKEHTILSDDISVVRKIDGEYKIFGSPFWGALGNKIGFTNLSVPIKSAYKLIQEKEDRIKEKKEEHALLDLVACVSFIPNHETQYLKILEFLHGFAKNIQIYDLYFTRECNFWRLIR